MKATRKNFIIIFILSEKLINTCNLSFPNQVIASKNLNNPTESNLKLGKSNSVQSTASSDFSERTLEQYDESVERAKKKIIVHIEDLIAKAGILQQDVLKESVRTL